MNLFFSDNAADAEISGIEGDFIYYPNVDGLSISGAFSLLDTEITDALIPTGDIVPGQELAFAPEMQGNIRVRQEFPAMNNNIGYVSAQLTFSEESFSDVMGPNRAPQDSYSMLDLRAGVTSPMLEEDSMNDGETLYSMNFGAGLKYSLYGVNLVVDYTMRNQSDAFNTSNVFSLGLVF